MKIGIDISQIVYDTGVSRYTWHLVENLLTIDKRNEYVLYGGSLRRRGEFEKRTNDLTGNFTLKTSLVSPRLGDVLWNRLRFMKIESVVGQVDVFHSSDWVQPPTDAKKVTTVHDLAPIKFPHLHDTRIVTTHRRKLELVKREVDKVIVPSRATMADLDEFGVDAGKIVVIPEASSKMMKRSSQKTMARIREKYRARKYLLAVGVNPRKNVNRIIEAFERVASPGMKLIFAGAVSMDVPKSRNIRFVGRVSDEELEALYSGAEALVFPSLYEGFGLPVLEAFSVGTPVVTSNLSSMPEVAGDAAVLVDPYSVDDIVMGITKALKNKRDLVKRGRAQVNKFSWEKAAKETIAVYEA